MIADAVRNGDDLPEEGSGDPTARGAGGLALRGGEVAGRTSVGGLLRGPSEEGGAGFSQERQRS